MQRTYRHGGARALVELHARELRAFLAVWRRARDAGLVMPPTEDPSCVSLESLLRHVLGAARGYMVWMCEVLELEDPAIEPLPEDLEPVAGAYTDHVLARWDGPLVDLGPEAADRPAYPSRWGVPYCIDAMLEHAVMHPLRHGVQLERLMAGS